MLDAIRKRVGPDFIVGIRMVADEDWEQGLSRAEGVEIARRLVASGQIDFLNLIRGQQKPSPRRDSIVVASIRGDLGLKTHAFLKRG